METFTFYNPTKLIYGIDQTDELASHLPKDAKILLVYGGGSVKKNGLYDKTIAQLEKAGATVTELAGIEPNPRLKTVRRGIELCLENDIDFILAVGGGSVIDATKAIAVGAKFDGDIWDIITKKETATGALPFGSILTLAATGSEMNAGSVITNWDTNEKIGWGSPYSFPTFSILDPKNTVSVPRDQTVYGMVDMMSHVLEAYFNRVDNTPLQDRICESILTTVIETAPKLLDDLDNLEHRGTILYCGTMALNGVTQMGARGDWGSHNIEHAVSAVSDIPHAGGLAIIFPHWLRNSIDDNPKPHVQLATRVFGVDPEGKTDQEVAEEGIQKLSEFWTSLGAPNRLADYDIDESQVDRMAGIAAANGEFGRYRVLDKEKTAKILTDAL
ncbi:iron-containing alcohol dehydrogenase [Alkalihalobacillus sp. FSL W8-0930]